MANQIYGPLDAALKITPAATKTAAFDSDAFDFSQGASAFSGDFPLSGGGIAMQAIIPITSFNVASTDETYTFKVQTSVDGLSGWQTCSRAASVGAVAANPTDTLAQPGLLFLEFAVVEKFYRLDLTVAGTAPSIIFGDCYFNPISRGL